MKKKTNSVVDRRNVLITAGAAATVIGTGQVFAQIAQTPAPTTANPALGVEMRLAQYAAGVHYEALPNGVVQACKRFLLDALACTFAAIGAPPAVIAEQTLRKAGTGGAATIIGSRQSISTEGAILINGILLRQLDLNDVYFGKDPAHPSEIIPAAIACCEEAKRSGRDLIEALVVGYESEVRLNDAFAWAPRGFIASSAAAFVAPLVAGKAWRMPVEQVVNAMGISGPRQLTALAVNSGEISMMKAVGPGYTVMDAVFSTRLAAAGMTGVSRGIEWLAANTGPKQANVDIDLDPQAYRLTKVGVKRFPLQGELQAVAEAGVNLHAKLQAQLAAIQAITVEAYPGTLGRGVAEPEKFHPANRETADHSLPICLAIALLDGDVTVKQYNDGRWKAPEVLALAQKVKVVIGQSLIAQMPEGHGTNVEVKLGNGQAVAESVLVPEGDAGKPMSRQAMEHKFRTFAEPVLGEAGASKVVGYVDRLEELKDISLFTTALRGRG
jgi:2-methylcitrate dehydratase